MIFILFYEVAKGGKEGVTATLSHPIHRTGILCSMLLCRYFLLEHGQAAEYNSEKRSLRHASFFYFDQIKSRLEAAGSRL